MVVKEQKQGDKPNKERYITIKPCKGKRGVWITLKSIVLPPIMQKEQHNRIVGKRK